MKDLSLKFGIITIISDFACMFLAWIGGYYLRLKGDFIPFVQYDIPYFPPVETMLFFFFYSSAVFLLLAAFNGLYNFHSTYSRIGELGRIIFLIITWGLLIIAFYALWKHKLFFSRVFLMQVLLFAVILLSISRISIRAFQRHLLRKGFGVINVLIIGTGEIVEKIKNKIGFSPQFKIISVINQFNTNKIYKNTNEIWYLTENEKEKNKILDYCQINQIGFSFIPNTEGILLSKLHTMMIGGYPLLTIVPTEITGWGRIGKRLFDLFTAIIVLTILLPFFVIIGIIIKLDSSGSIFYSSVRIGRNGEKFKMYKFRSMISNAEEIKQKLIKYNQRKGPLFKIKEDPRITTFGRFLRRFSIDELPQFWNVLIGNMSIVGPRAHLPEEVKKYDDLQKRVLTIKPGITGLPQVNGRSNLPFEEEIRLDLHYISSWSMFLDIQIILQTPFVLLKGDGAD